MNPKLHYRTYLIASMYKVSISLPVTSTTLQSLPNATCFPTSPYCIPVHEEHSHFAAKVTVQKRVLYQSILSRDYFKSTVESQLNHVTTSIGQVSRTQALSIATSPASNYEPPLSIRIRGARKVEGPANKFGYKQTEFPAASVAGDHG